MICPFPASMSRPGLPHLTCRTPILPSFPLLPCCLCLVLSPSSAGSSGLHCLRWAPCWPLRCGWLGPEHVGLFCSLDPSFHQLFLTFPDSALHTLPSISHPPPWVPPGLLAASTPSPGRPPPWAVGKGRVSLSQPPPSTVWPAPRASQTPPVSPLSCSSIWVSPSTLCPVGAILSLPSPQE